MVSSTFQHDPPLISSPCPSSFTFSSLLSSTPTPTAVHLPPCLIPFPCPSSSTSSSTLLSSTSTPTAVRRRPPPYPSSLAFSTLVSSTLTPTPTPTPTAVHSPSSSSSFVFFPLLSSTPRPQLFTSAPLSSLTFSVVLLSFFTLPFLDVVDDVRSQRFLSAPATVSIVYGLVFRLVSFLVMNVRHGRSFGKSTKAETHVISDYHRRRLEALKKNRKLITGLSFEGREHLLNTEIAMEVDNDPAFPLPPGEEGIFLSNAGGEVDFCHELFQIPDASARR
ncbi:hypothetical protein A0H81_12563 [Grifola frondosa]|uniref:Uncharacterized protein n=1 Tax=Grifola frondosa TaxID=5627 RepID=A0A1C7LS00_GRIFR|nr:hypothetical protein A0H81_12563 [Grifola frondosa]